MLLQDVDLLIAAFPQFHELLQAHNSDPYQVLECDENLKKTGESYRTLLRSHDRRRIHEQLELFFACTGNDVFRLFPTSSEVAAELLPILNSLREEMPFYTTNLTLSHPVGVPETTSLNVILRMYDSNKRNIVKIKIGSFFDSSQRNYWEVGFVDVFKSIRNIHQYLHSPSWRRGDYFLLMRLVDCTKRFIRRRPGVSGLDLTPAYSHVMQLCRRLGGRTVSSFDWAAWNRDLDCAYQYSLSLLDTSARDSDWNAVQAIHKRYVISWMFEHGLMKDSTGKILAWDPPRLIWSSREN